MRKETATIIEDIIEDIYGECPVSKTPNPELARNEMRVARKIKNIFDRSTRDLYDNE